MGTESIKKLMDDVRKVSRDMHDNKPGSVNRAVPIVNRLRLLSLDFSVRSLTSEIEAAKKRIPKKDW
jgi:hypothetical protein